MKRGKDMALSEALPEAEQGAPAPVGFLSNVLWNWFGISISLLSALVLSPFVIRKLGDDNYGLWILERVRGLRLRRA